ncbi:hypothetical protein TTHERM_000370649 (macronuclear) [Tetrahymena thermophila SB210]|uniref:Kinase domain protein n=1 Tax=Tetrahymena thermophila (strain SB210) TaxID=312017 RepID=W7XLC0_TETTS|nr:hypothetical protein TTHERM_000370649 [Tetrahymena thermophila SB210]EWS76024.1 hypothetical protein TTHERM_000370649 [Tetrahymena thermophila SB210]|eukprot:XP_012651462.1 hypothetical protein TTHERM_000370649 [Tetrahymena thermophila SB210]
MCDNNIFLYIKNRYNQISDEEICSLSEGLPKCTSLESFFIELIYNKVGQKGISALSKALSQCHKLSDLCLQISDNVFGSEGACILGDGLENQSVKQVVKEYLDYLKNCTTIENLAVYLYNSKTSTQGIIDLSNAIVNLVNLNTLRLDLRNNNITDPVKYELKEILDSMQKLVNQEIDY